jgi:hypothetical protein
LRDTSRPVLNCSCGVPESPLKRAQSPSGCTKYCGADWASSESAATGSDDRLGLCHLRALDRAGRPSRTECCTSGRFYAARLVIQFLILGWSPG